MTLTPNFLPVGSVVEKINISDEWNPFVIDHLNLKLLSTNPSKFNNHYRPIQLTPEILTEWCDAKRGKVFLLEYRISNRLFIFRDGKCFDYGSNVQLDYLHELQLLFLGMKQVLTVTIK